MARELFIVPGNAITNEIKRNTLRKDFFLFLLVNSFNIVLDGLWVRGEKYRPFCQGGKIGHRSLALRQSALMGLRRCRVTKDSKDSWCVLSIVSTRQAHLHFLGDADSVELVEQS